MKKRVSAIFIVMCLLFTVGMTGCKQKTKTNSNSNNSGSTTDSQTTYTSDLTQSDPNEPTETTNDSELSTAPDPTSGGATNKPTSAPPVAADPNITLFVPYGLDTKPEIASAIKAYESKYKAKVTVIEEPDYNQRQVRLTNLVNGKQRIDVLLFGIEDMPMYPISGLIKEINTSKIDIKSTHFDKNSIDNIYSLNGKTYGLTCNGLPNRMLIYNKTMFENAGLDTPRQLYDKNKWNWNAFRQAAAQLTDASIDTWGFAAYNINDFLSSNGTSALKKNGATYKSNMGDSKVKESYQLYYDMVNVDKSVLRSIWDWSKYMQNNKLAMVCEPITNLHTWAQAGVKFQLDFVPFPKGPGASEHYNSSLSGYNYGLATTCKNEDGAYQFINFVCEWWVSKGASMFDGDYKFSNDQKQFLQKMGKLKSNPYSPIGFGTMKSDALTLITEIRGGKPVGTVLEYWETQFQQTIDVTMSGAKK